LSLIVSNLRWTTRTFPTAPAGRIFEKRGFYERIKVEALGDGSGGKAFEEASAERLVVALAV
jgi:hypothetical protein